MANSVGPLGRATVSRRVGTLGLLMLVAGFVAAILAGPSAHASTSTPRQAAPNRHCTPPTNPYNTSTTLAECGTTTTVPQSTVTLSVSYQSTVLTWHACVSSTASVQGSQVQLYVDGTLVDSASVGANGCTPSKSLSLCLKAGRHTATAVDQPYGQASVSFEARNSQCTSPNARTASAGQTGGGRNGDAASGAGHAGFLAFTGADIVLMAAGAAALIAVGYAVVRRSRPRGHSA